VPRHFFGHAQAEDRLLHGVVEDVEPDKAGIKIAVRYRTEDFIGLRFRQSILKREYTRRCAACQIE
jgi:hypothetical protein